MGLRLRRTASAAGMGDDDVARLDRSYRIAISKRVRAFPEPDPQFLHPARSALILLNDVQVRDPAVLEAALLFDSVFAALSTGAEDAIAAGLEDAAVYLAALPSWDLGDAELVESLVLLDYSTLAIALAERLDHARHLHFTHRRGWASFHDQVARVYLPVAHRSGILAARFDAWTEAFARRLSRPGSQD